jgi:hypothetical protein
MDHASSILERKYRGVGGIPDSGSDSLVPMDDDAKTDRVNAAYAGYLYYRQTVALERLAYASETLLWSLILGTLFYCLGSLIGFGIDVIMEGKTK